MACFKCKRTGEVCCDADEQDLKCHICGFCEREAVKDECKEGFGEGKL